MAVKAVHSQYVAIEALPIDQDPNAVLEKTEQSQLKEARKQNHGIIKAMGKKVEDWLKVGDTVSFYRNAATPVNIDGEELLLVHQDHVLVNFVQ